MGQFIFYSFFTFFSNHPKSFGEYGVAAHMTDGDVPKRPLAGVKSSRIPNFHADSCEDSDTQSGSTMVIVDKEIVRI